MNMGSGLLVVGLISPPVGLTHNFTRGVEAAQRLTVADAEEIAFLFEEVGEDLSTPPTPEDVSRVRTALVAAVGYVEFASRGELQDCDTVVFVGGNRQTVDVLLTAGVNHGDEPSESFHQFMLVQACQPVLAALYEDVPAAPVPA